jgi:hypothetical protein
MIRSYLIMSLICTLLQNKGGVKVIFCDFVSFCYCGEQHMLLFIYLFVFLLLVSVVGCGSHNVS